MTSKSTFSTRSEARCRPCWFMGTNGGPADRQVIHDELERVRDDFHDLVARASDADLRRRTKGTRWTNGQMLWHMAFGYLLVRRLRPLVRLFGRLPDPFSRAFAAVLNAGTRPFRPINYLGSAAGALVFHGPRLTRQLNHSIDVLHRRLDAESDKTLQCRMRFPVGWDPFFRNTMTLEQVYHHGTQHYDFHRAQLALRPDN